MWRSATRNGPGGRNRARAVSAPPLQHRALDRMVWACRRKHQGRLGGRWLDSLAAAPRVKGVHLTQGADSQDRFSQETGEAVMACARFGKYLHRRGGPTDSRLSSRQDVPV